MYSGSIALLAMFSVSFPYPVMGSEDYPLLQPSSRQPIMYSSSEQDQVVPAEGGLLMRHSEQVSVIFCTQIVLPSIQNLHNSCSLLANPRQLTNS
ncbi:unnamed protein product [Calicophoron daubneyi]|uniref:Uncharacterized protein n=1 Tax=Calicophoron daubneyi TaxID=300641 RepID=A0AAV2SZS8_CALDB